MARDGDGLPQASASPTYNNFQVNCALLPVEAVIARNRKIVATVSKTDYEEVRKSGSAGGGGALFGIFGGGGNQSWSTKTISDDGH